MAATERTADRTVTFVIAFTALLPGGDEAASGGQPPAFCKKMNPAVMM